MEFSDGWRLQRRRLGLAGTVGNGRRFGGPCRRPCDVAKHRTRENCIGTRAAGRQSRSVHGGLRGFIHHQTHRHAGALRRRWQRRPDMHHQGTARRPAEGGQAPAATEPGMAEQTASADESVAPATAVAAAVLPEMPPAIEPSGAPLPVLPPQAEESSAGETAEATPEVAAAMPSATEPAAAQPTSASSEAAAPLPAEATAP